MKVDSAACWVSITLLLLFATNSLPILAAPTSPPPPLALPPLPLWTDNRTTMTVCTSSYTPMVSCDPDTGKEFLLIFLSF
jgi:hypothetical protein